MKKTQKKIVDFGKFVQDQGYDYYDGGCFWQRYGKRYTDEKVLHSYDKYLLKKKKK